MALAPSRDRLVNEAAHRRCDTQGPDWAFCMALPGTRNGLGFYVKLAVERSHLLLRMPLNSCRTVCVQAGSPVSAQQPSFVFSPLTFIFQS